MDVIASAASSGPGAWDHGWDEDVAAFAAEVRAYLVEGLRDAAAHSDPADLTGLAEPFERDFVRGVGARGYLGVQTPDMDSGDGPEAAPGRRGAFEFVVAACDAPVIDTALTLAGYPIARFGSAEQRAYFLPRMVRGEVTMCIAYSEIDAGSDLRAIATTACRDGDGYVLSGRKTLVTGAHKADWCCTVARTGDDALTMFVLPMDTAGVVVRRRPTMNGWTLDEIEFASARVGTDAVLGEPDHGWRQLVGAVRAEGSGMFHLGFARNVLDALLEHVRTARRDGRPMVEDVLVRDALARLEIDYAAGTRLARRTSANARDDSPRPELAAMTKVFVTELLQRIARTATEIAGHRASAWAPQFDPEPAPAAAGGRFGWEFLERVHGTISVGNNELQRDAIARFGLGLTAPRPA